MSMQDSQQISDVKVMLLKGDSGKGIESIIKTGTLPPLDDIYTITYTDGSKSTFNVTNGNGITSIAKTGTSGALTDVYTITFDDGSTETFNVTNGNGISSIAKTGTSGNVDTYTITMTDGTEYTFTVTNAEQAGHTIKDEGVPMTDRAAIDFVDFDLTDDSVNDETKIAPHRLSSAEMSEICSPLPDAPTLVGNVRMTLLWTNPDTSQSRGAGDIVENVTSDKVLIQCLAATSSYVMYTPVIIDKGFRGASYATGPSSSSVQWFRRMFTYNNNKVSMATGEKQTQGTSVTTDASIVIPYKVYGIDII